MTDRKFTCVACKSAVTKDDIEHSDLEFGGELKATNQPEYTADADTDLVATVGTLDAYTPMLRTSGEQKALGVKQGLWTGYKYNSPTPTTDGKWLRYMSIPCRYVLTLTEIVGTVGNNGLCYAKAITSGTNGFNRIFSINNQPGNSGIKVACSINQADNKMEFWIYVPVVNNVAGMIFYNMFIDTAAVDGAIYYNTEFDSLPAEGYTTFVYILGSA